MKPRVPISATGASEKLPPRVEADLVAAAARLFRSGFPNAERTGCPPREALLSAARNAASDVESRNVLDHLTCCSPCFVEYERLVRKDRLSKKFKLLALCASVLLAVGTAIWFYAASSASDRRQPSPIVVEKERSPRVPPVETAVLDLRNRSSVRGDRQPPTSNDVATLWARRLDLSVYLPIGSEEGEYEMQIFREAAKPLFSQTGTATLVDQDVVVRMRTDLTSLEPGRYILGLRRGGFTWRYYPVTLAK